MIFYTTVHPRAKRLSLYVDGDGCCGSSSRAGSGRNLRPALIQAVHPARGGTRSSESTGRLVHPRARGTHPVRTPDRLGSSPRATHFATPDAGIGRFIPARAGTRVGTRPARPVHPRARAGTRPLLGRTGLVHPARAGNAALGRTARGDHGSPRARERCSSTEHRLVDRFIPARAGNAA
jgi:hypothetical protein